MELPVLFKLMAPPRHRSAPNPSVFGFVLFCFKASPLFPIPTSFFSQQNGVLIYLIIFRASTCMVVAVVVCFKN